MRTYGTLQTTTSSTSETSEGVVREREIHTEQSSHVVEKEKEIHALLIGEARSISIDQSIVNRSQHMQKLKPASHRMRQ